MLQIRHVNKEYHTGDLVQRALDDVTISLRDNEFVAVLGPSGSGKTTLLNIIGGLDRYDSGELIINGVSTKEYSDRDWDSYRNHTVGFVFQSYNLIPHQTVLANVELALTISGVGRKERRARAMEALDHVGLADQAHKLPAQLSGGQMQRVAIARALVNNPSIVLADEPTGALDTDTSLQVMNLLKEVARDRMVVMVTHNPELAETYATRIIRLQDGAVCADSDPYEPEEIAAATHKKPPRSGMSLWTSAGLSLRNLMTKKARTILTSIAGSIGIIGIALILAIAAGVNGYIDVLEAEMALQNPIEIENSYYDISAFMTARVIPGTTEEVEVYDEDTVDISALIYNIFSGQSANDLVALKEYIDEDGGGINSYVTSIEYDYGITPQIYQNNSERVVQVHPDHFFDILGFGSTTSANSIMSSLVNTDAFFQMPESDELYKNNYTVRAGRWPESYNELVLVLHEGTQTTDIGLYMTGLEDIADMEEMIDEFVNGDEVVQPAIDNIYTVDDFVGIQFKLVKNTDLYEYDSEYGVWTDRSDDEAYMQQLVDNGEVLTIVGVVELNEGEDSGILSSGFNYMPSLVTHLADEAAGSEIVQQQLADPDINVFTGEPFGEDDSEEFDLNSLFNIDEDTVMEIFSFDDDEFEEMITGTTEDLTDSFSGEDVLGGMDLSGLVDLGSITISLPDIDLSLDELMSSVRITVTEEDLTNLGIELLDGFRSYVSGNPRADIFQIGSAFAEYLSTAGAQEILEKNITDIIRGSGGITLSTESIRSLYSMAETDFVAWARENGYLSITQLSQLNNYIDQYLGTSRAQGLLDSWADEYLQNSMSDITISEAQLQTLASDLANGYEAYAAANPDVPDPALVGNYFGDYLGTSSAQEIFSSSFSSMISVDGLEAQIESALTSYADSAASSIMSDVGTEIEDQIAGAAQEITVQIQAEISDLLTESMAGLGDSIQDALDVDPSALLDAVEINMDAMQLLDLLSTVTSSGADSYESNLEALGYTDFTTPKSISIYPKDFQSKDEIVNILDNYNAQAVAAGEDDKVVTYSDSIGSIMSLIEEIVNILSYVLIAFVAISLVVSCIMIGVITYISVLERKKEIGILRAIGASKRNISQVFNSETAIIGLIAGVLGIVVTLLLILPINYFIHSFFGIYELSAYLPFWYAVILIVLSVVLTLLSGMIPARKASRSDPVEALRSE